MSKEQRFLDAKGVEVLWKQIDLNDYPNNETLIAVLNAIDETKADKNEIKQSDWNQNDKNAADYIKNRTHYEEIVETGEATEVYNGSVTNRIMLNVITYDFGFGEMLYVTFDDVKYKLYGHWSGVTCSYTSNDGDVPFYVVYDMVDAALYFTCKDSETHMVLIEIPVIESIVHKLDSKFIPDSVVKKDYLTQQLDSSKPDWNQSDETAVDYIKNKPFGEDIQYSVVVDEKEIECYTAKDNGYYTFIEDEYVHEDFLLGGKGVAFLWDGKIYDVEEGNTSHNGYHYVYYGNAYLLGISDQDTGLPFCVRVIIGDYIEVVGIEVYARTQGNHTIALYAKSSVVKTIDEKYLPDSVKNENIVQLQSDWNQSDEWSDDYIKNRPFYEETIDTGDVETLYEGSYTFSAMFTLPETIYNDVLYVTFNEENYTLTRHDINPITWGYESTDGTELPFSIYYDGLNNEMYFDLFGYEFTTDKVDVLIQAPVIETNIVQLDEKFIPETVARSSDLEPLNNKLTYHTDVEDVHMTDERKTQLTNAYTHSTNSNIHLTSEEKAQLLSHKDDVDNPHQILEKIEANSDLVVTELGDEIVGDSPELDPVVESRISEIETEVSSLKSDLVKLEDSIPKKTSQLTNDSSYATERELSEKLDKNQGSANVGKIFEIGSDGNVILVNKSTAFALTDDERAEIIDEITRTVNSDTEVSASNVAQGDTVTLRFPSMEGNRVYYGGKNLFDGVIGNFAVANVSGNPVVMVASNYRGFFCPIKGGETMTLSRSASINNSSSERFYYGFTAELPANNVPLLEAYRQPGRTALTATYTAPANAKYLVVYLSNASDDWSGIQFQVEHSNVATEFEAYCGNIVTTSEDGITVTGTNNFVVWCDSCKDSEITILKKKDMSSIVDEKINNALEEVNEQIDESLNFNMFDSDTGNVSIVCAKEHTYNDGTPPKVEYYLLEECGTKRFYVSSDLKSKKYAFTFNGDSEKYAFGITKNNDIIACAIADSLESGKDDSHRVNPYCWLASENWSTQHEVAFGDNLKPCGWLSNCGYRNLPNGDALFSEYTRTTVATANVWKLSGTPTDVNNWTVVKSFEITTEDNLVGFKHIHTVQYDHHSGVVYFSTGDDDNNAMIFYSTDNGATWTQLGTSSQKYCRNLCFTFTKDYVYWAPDYDIASGSYLFRATRNTNGVIDFSNIEDYVFIGGFTQEELFTNKGATYGTAYLEELNAILILDRCDSQREYMPLLIVDLKNGTLQKLMTLESPSEAHYVGFRTRYSEWYPKNGKFICGFGLKQVGNFICTNHIKGFGNMGYMNTGTGAHNINNLIFQVQRNGDTFNVKMDTLYI